MTVSRGRIEKPSTNHEHHSAPILHYLLGSVPGVLVRRPIALHIARVWNCKVISNLSPSVQIIRIREGSDWMDNRRSTDTGLDMTAERLPAHLQLRIAPAPNTTTEPNDSPSSVALRYRQR